MSHGQLHTRTQRLSSTTRWTRVRRAPAISIPTFLKRARRCGEERKSGPRGERRGPIRFMTWPLQRRAQRADVALDRKFDIWSSGELSMGLETSEWRRRCCGVSRRAGRCHPSCGRALEASTTSFFANSIFGLPPIVAPLPYPRPAPRRALDAMERTGRHSPAASGARLSA